MNNQNLTHIVANCFLKEGLSSTPTNLKKRERLRKYTNVPITKVFNDLMSRTLLICVFTQVKSP